MTHNFGLAAALLLAACGSAESAAVAADAGAVPEADAPLAAADAGAVPDAELDAGPPLEVGSSPTGFARLSEGGPIVLSQGAQCGFHVYLALRARGVAPGTLGESPRACSMAGNFTNPCVTFEVLDDATGTALDQYTPLRLRFTASSDEPGAFDLAPRAVVMNVPSGNSATFEGKRLKVRAAVDDATGKHVEVTLGVICTVERFPGC